MEHSIFRHYDIRGRIPDQLPFHDIYGLARAIILFYQKADPTLNTIILGADGRLSTPFIKKEVLRACRDSHISVIDIGVCPTPVFYYTLHTHTVTSGIMITASHNGKDYNGFKLRLNKKPVWGEQIEEIKQIFLFLKKQLDSKEKLVLSLGTLSDKDKAEQKLIEQKRACLVTRVTKLDPITPYINFLAEQFPHLENQTFRAIIDCSHATASIVIPRLISRFNWVNVKTLFAQLNGSFPAHPPDPSNEKNLMHLKQSLSCDSRNPIGLAFDGDADRLSAITETETALRGDQLLELFSIPILQNTPQAPIIYDIKCSHSLVCTIKQNNGTGTMAPSGHTYIQEFMSKHQALLGGELSGHFFFADRYFGFDDGIYAMMRLLEILTLQDTTLAQLSRQLSKTVTTPELRVPCKEEQKEVIISSITKEFQNRSDISLITLDGARIEYPFGWGIIRASHTEPVLSMRFEAETEAHLDQIKNDFKKVLVKHISSAIVNEYF